MYPCILCDLMIYNHRLFTIRLHDSGRLLEGKDSRRFGEGNSTPLQRCWCLYPHPRKRTNSSAEKRDENWTIGNETSEPTINFQGTFVSFLGGYLLGGWKKYENIFPQVWWFNLVVESNKLNKQKFTGLYKLEFPNWNSNYFMEGFLKNNLSKDTKSRLVARVYLPTSIP